MTDLRRMSTPGNSALRWIAANYDDRLVATAAARDRFGEMFPEAIRATWDGLDAREVARRAVLLRKLYFSRMAVARVHARRERARGVVKTTRAASRPITDRLAELAREMTEQ